MRGYFKIILIVLMISICVLFMCGCEKEAKVLLGHDAETELSVTTADMDKKRPMIRLYRKQRIQQTVGPTVWMGRKTQRCCMFISAAK